MKKPLLLFDLDDTLVDSESAYSRALQEIDLSSTDQQFLKARAEVKGTLGEGHVSARNRWLYMKRLLENRNEFSAEKIIQNMENYERALLADLKGQWISLDRESLFQKLKSKFELGILTNENTRMQILKLSALDPKGRYFSWMITSEEIGFEKPHPRIFEALTKRYPELTMGTITFVGDSLKNDIEPGLKLGWEVIWTQEFLKEKKTPPYSNVTVLNKLDDILNFVAK